MSSTLAPKPNSLKVGDTDPLVATLSDQKGPVNLAGATVHMRMRSRVAGSGHADIDGVCTVLQGVDGNGRITNRGMVEYPWAAGETDVIGVYGLDWPVTFGDGKTRTFPNHGTVTLEIEPSQVGGGGATSSLTRVGATLAALGVGTADGDLGLVRIGTWPNQHEELMLWNAALGQWVGEDHVVLTQNDTTAMDLGNRSGSALLDWSIIDNAVPYAKAFTKLVGAQAANSATITVATTAPPRVPFTDAGVIAIRDNVISYTGRPGGAGGTTFTGCTLISGSGGVIPAGTDVTQGYSGGWGLIGSPLLWVGEMWAAGFRLQERMFALMNGAPDGAHALSVAPYWYEFDNLIGSSANTIPPTGGIGFSATLVGTTDAGGNKDTERAFFAAENNWTTWAAGTPTRRYMIPKLAGKMAAGATDTGEVLDVKLLMRWVG